MTALGSVPKAHTQGEPDGTWNLEKLHLELKYLGRKLADAKLQTDERRRRSIRTRFDVTCVENDEKESCDRPRLLVPFRVLCSKDVHRAVVTGHADEGRVLVEVNAAKDESQRKIMRSGGAGLS